jgi:radical SAM protein with 4Fe4S-binding SPASM domain
MGVEILRNVVEHDGPHSLVLDNTCLSCNAKRVCYGVCQFGFHYNLEFFLYLQDVRCMGKKLEIAATLSSRSS